MTQTLAMPQRVALDALFSGEQCSVVLPSGQAIELHTRRWFGDADHADRHLFLDQCRGRTLDVGCGPGRLVGALTGREGFSIGIDVSAAAVRLTKRRGAVAFECDVYGDVPDARAWQHVLLADGNIGIGGHPVKLLRRVRDLMSPDGTVLVEVDSQIRGIRRDRLCLRLGELFSEPFWWAQVGTDAIAELAAQAGLQMLELREHGSRHVAVLVEERRSLG